MIEAEEPVSGKAALAAALGALQDKLRARGRTQKAAVDEANRRRRKAAGRREEVPWPRKDGGEDLSVQAVNDWFPKRDGSKEPSVPRDFADLWSVVAVLLDWTGLPDRRPAAGEAGRWKDLHERARRPIGLDEEVRAYLEAARKAAEQHPHQGFPGGAVPPSLSEVYVRQVNSRTARNGQDAYGPVDDVVTDASPEPAEAIFRKADRVCVLVAGPGGGKSTLLRTWLRDAAEEWLGGTGRSPAAVPVWVSARALTGEATPVPEALSAATRSLSRYGLRPGLDEERFLQRPCEGARWQLLVDGLDELPNADERRAVLEKLANAVASDPALYRCVVATRPAAENELAVLDQVLGDKVPRYDLQPFTVEDVRAYTERYFSTRWPAVEASQRSRRFTGSLRDASLTELAQTPLMAFMLCQLYLARPDRPLPSGRTRFYELFTDLIYENNRGKRIADSHQEAIQLLVTGLQSPQARKEAGEATQRVHELLPELIDCLAHQWITGHQAPAATVLATHSVVRRPDKVHPELWGAFVEDLLRHTGLLVYHADGLGFPHQTFLEYHAARHATRDRHARQDTLDQLFVLTTDWRDQEPSYVGFLLDRLLASRDDGISRQTEVLLEELADSGGVTACRFLMNQVRLRTRLPAESTAVQLGRFATDPALAPFDRLSAVKVLLEVDVVRGARLLASLANGPFDKVYQSMEVGEALARVDGHRESTARIRKSLATALGNASYSREEAAWRVEARTVDESLSVSEQLRVAKALLEADVAWTVGLLAEVGAARTARLLESIVTGSDIIPARRLRAALVLTRLDGYCETGARLLETLTEGDTFDRLQPVRALAEVDSERAVRVLRARALDPVRTNVKRLQAARLLLEVDLEQGARLYETLAEETTLGAPGRLQAAGVLAELDGYRLRGAQLLDAMAMGPCFDASDRVWAAAALARTEGHEEHGARLLETLTTDPTLDAFGRYWASRRLAELREKPVEGR